VIALLRGSLLEKNPSRLIVEVGGVGYDVQVPLSTFYVVGEPGADVTLRVHTHVREDVIALYGFATTLEQDLFERLIAISGIGPKLALARLTAIPGIGKKTAERIGLEMKDRLPAALPTSGQDTQNVKPEDQLRNDLLSALMNLGYQRAVAEKAIENALKGRTDLPFEHALRDVLRALMRT
jgi:Holliday junction DNA helicase RuvA